MTFPRIPKRHTNEGLAESLLTRQNTTSKRLTPRQKKMRARGKTWLKVKNPTAPGVTRFEGEDV
jgi:hypothetical protein